MEEDHDLCLPIREISRKREKHLRYCAEEWRRREKEIPMIGQPLVEFWLLQVTRDVSLSFSIRSLYFYDPEDRDCHTEIVYGSLEKEETSKLIDKCHCEGVTVTSMISRAHLSAAMTLITDSTATFVYSIAADTRRRCLPPVPNHDLSYHVSAVAASEEISTTFEVVHRCRPNRGLR